MQKPWKTLVLWIWHFLLVSRKILNVLANTATIALVIFMSWLLLAGAVGIVSDANADLSFPLFWSIVSLLCFSLFWILSNWIGKIAQKRKRGRQRGLR